MSKVVKGFKKVVKGIGKVVKKIAKSKVFKAIAIAAAVYFTGGAALGAIKGAAAGTGFMGTLSGAVTGAGAGLSSAMGGITGAWTSLTTSGGLSGAGSSLAGGWGMGGTAAGAAGGAGAAAGTTGTLNLGAFGSGGATQVTGLKAAETVATKGLLSTIASNPMTMYGVTQLAGGAMAGKGQQQHYETERADGLTDLADQRLYAQQQAEEDRRRLNIHQGTPSSYPNKRTA
jgi:hypothetical protein